VRLEAQPFSGTLARRLAKPAPPGLSLCRLGQAGFVLRTKAWTVLIDPYLSDSLAEKYKGRPLPHIRMMPPPITVEELDAIDLVFCTHHHTDHMDPSTLAPLLRRQSAMRLVVPRAKLVEVMTRGGVVSDRVIGMDAGERSQLLPGLTAASIRAAHEMVERDDMGAHIFLGFAITTSEATVVHSGDTIPFPGQKAEMCTLRADLALLPVNGRPAELAAARAGQPFPG
jgi:L-ascorbate metabolism protein UlaG (beta-lactamase superfamily)